MKKVILESIQNHTNPKEYKLSKLAKKYYEPGDNQMKLLHKFMTILKFEQTENANIYLLQEKGSDLQYYFEMTSSNPHFNGSIHNIQVNPDKLFDHVFLLLNNNLSGVLLYLNTVDFRPFTGS